MTGYRVDAHLDGDDIVTVTLSRAASFETIAGPLRELEALRPRRVLMDESGLRPGLVSPSHIQQIAKLWRNAAALRGARIAVFAPSPVIYGLNRMFQAWAGEEVRVAVFTGRGDATAWLLASTPER